MNSASLCSLAGRYDNTIPPRFLAPRDSLKIPALRHSVDPGPEMNDVFDSFKALYSAYLVGKQRLIRAGLRLEAHRPWQLVARVYSEQQVLQLSIQGPEEQQKCLLRTFFRKYLKSNRN